MLTVKIVSEDIARVPVDALITTHNSFGFGPGSIDRVITDEAHDMFHPQVPSTLKSGEAFLARASGAHSGSFRHVLFVGDDWDKPLHEIVLAALKRAEAAKLSSVSLPMMRTGAAKGMSADSKQQNMRAMVAGMKQFQASGPRHLKSIVLVTYKDSSAEKYFRQALSL